MEFPTEEYRHGNWQNSDRGIRHGLIARFIRLFFLQKAGNRHAADLYDGGPAAIPIYHDPVS